MKISTLDNQISKIEGKILEYKAKVEELKGKKKSEEDAQILKLVREMNMSVEDLREKLLPIKSEEEKIDV